MKVDYNTQYEKLTASLKYRPTLLLHVCCAPCFTSAIDVVKHFDVTLYYYNPNIYPKEEYDKRFAELERYVREVFVGVKIIAEPYNRTEYDEATGATKGMPEHGEKCKKCIESRLDKTARKARELGFEYFGTTLTSSRQKDAEYINGLSEDLAKKYGVKNLPSDFKKKGGDVRIKTACDLYGIYRQTYCGCVCPKVVVAVTGGIASGKSEFVGMLGSLGAYTISADRITRYLQESDEDVKAQISNIFPEVYVWGILDRKALAKIVFGNAEDRIKLERVLHPRISSEIKRVINASDAQIVAVEVPLLFESGFALKSDLTVTVSAPVELRKSRALLREGMTEEKFFAVLKAQLTDEEREARADVIIKNDGDKQALFGQAKELIEKCTSLIKQ